MSLAILFGIAPAVSAQEDAALSRFVRALAAADIPAANVSVVSQPLESNGKALHHVCRASSSGASHDAKNRSLEERG